MINFPSKILLFGEYVVLLRAKALAMPYPLFFSQLKIHDDRSIAEVNDVNSNQVLLEFYQYIRKTIHQTDMNGRFDLDAFKSDIDRGLYLESNIPVGYGIGSSGSLTAAVYDKYSRKYENTDISRDLILQIKNDLAYLESFFHGNSSGIDPMVSYFRKPLLFRNNRIIVLNDSFYQKDSLEIFLVDTGISRKTADLVQSFLSNCMDAQYSDAIQQMILSSNACIKALLADNCNAFFYHGVNLSVSQFAFFKPIILPSIQSFWEEGFQSGNYFLKLCGSGSGGYLLAFVNNLEAFVSGAEQHKLSVIPVRF